MSRVMVVCPTHRDLRELSALEESREHMFACHEYASDALENLTAADRDDGISISDPEDEIETLVDRCVRERIDAVVSADDYPGSTLAAIVARRLGLPGVAPQANLLCQHKYFCRELQREAAPDAAPWCRLIDVRAEAPLPPDLDFPAFVKPAKSFFSVGARRVESPAELVEAKREWADAYAFFAPFDRLLRRYAGRAMGHDLLVAEGLLRGQQVTLDGYVHNGECRLMGVTDSIMFPGTIAFQRFEYPSSLPAEAQEKMFEIARRVMLRIGFDNGQFNIEFMYDGSSGDVGIIEINPRMSSQFGDLFEKVDGTNGYSVMLALALGREPLVKRRAGRHKMAASCVLRTFENRLALKLPTAEEIERARERYSDIRIEILATEGRKLSQQMQDGHSYRYGLINIGGEDRAHILNAFDQCLEILTFSLAPV
ncbi:MAG TPA: ATP-grasp domain-containing protein [Candidatus Binataceae bacterium]|nr:ATP-grasp domain-containing protein [Candidatus Binataceae bacterium]